MQPAVQRRALRWALILGSVALIAAATLLPFGATPAEQLPPRWCLACGGMWAADGVSNILLFVPLGAALAFFGLGAAPAIALGAALSLAVELSQSLGVPPGRSPAIADLLTNTLGTGFGWLLYTIGPSLWSARGRRAGVLAALWWGLAGAVLIGTAAAEHRGSQTPGTVTRSRFEYSPVYGWYGGAPIQAWFAVPASIGRWAVPHRGSGPIVAQTDAPSDHWEVELLTAGRDSATYRRALLYLHTANDSTAEVVIAQRDRAAELLVRRRAWDWGLAFPRLSLPYAFGAPGTSDTARITARVRPDRLTLMSGDRSAALSLTPGFGWAMLQTVVGVGDPLAPLVESTWLIVLFAPVAWWSARANRPAAPWLAALATAMLLLEVGPFMGVAEFAARELLFVTTVWLIALGAGRRSLPVTPGIVAGNIRT